MAQPQVSSAAATAYTLASVQATQALRERVAHAVTLIWRSLGVYRNAQMAEFTAQAVPLVEAAMAQMSSLTAGYLALHSQEAGFSAVPVGVPTPTVQSVRGVPASEVYGRPFHLVWRELGAHNPVDAAIKSGLDRAVETALTDVQLAKTHTVQAVTLASPITARPYWYKRVLEGPKSCALCIVASTQAYHVKGLLPIHPGCDCSVEPQWTAQPDQVIDPDLLAAAHDAIQEKFGLSDAGARNPDYRKILLVHEHSELGPVLTVAGHHFTQREARRSGLNLDGLPRL